MPDPVNRTQSFDGAYPPFVDAPPPTVSHHAGDGPYRDLTPHARGGLGEVLSATDHALNRTVAVKRLLPHRVGNPECRRRFLVEAEVTARLEHPGVVPVYALFADDAGGPAYAMRFVDGPTLWDALRQYHTGEPDAVAFRRLLQAFIRVCQTVAYAHSRGVIHRDLKPQNILMGKFGETLVVDWGLAKVVGRPDEARAMELAEETLQPSSGSGDETAMGSAVGTPAFMSPEQAAGRWNVIDHRSDVYGLGAVLYTLLTGQAPLGKGDWPELQQRIQRGDFPRPRQAKPSVPRPLEAVCLKAMALDPAARYGSAEAVAADIEHWLADEPVTACREPLAARGRRWMRRHRTVVTTGVALLVATLAAAAVGLVLLGQKNEQIVAERNAARVAADEAEAVNAFLTDDLLGQADPDLNSRDKKVTVEDVLARAAARIDGNAKFADKPTVEATLRAAIGKTYHKLGDFPKAERHLRRALELRRANLPTDDLRTFAVQRDLGWMLSDAGRGQDAAALLEATWKGYSRLLGADDLRTLGTQGEYALSLGDSGRPAEAEAMLRDCLAKSEARHGWDELVTLEAAGNLSVLLTDAGRAADALPLLRKGYDHSRRALGESHTNTLATANNLSRALMFVGEYGEAEKVIRRGYEVCRDSKEADHHHTLHMQSLLAEVHLELGRAKSAVALATDCLTRRRRVLPARHSNLARTMIVLGRAHLETGHPAAADPLLAEAADICGGAEPQQPYLGQAQAWRAVCLLATGKPTEAGPLLASGFPVLRSHPAVTKGQAKKLAERVAAEYDRIGKPAEAMTWRAEAAR